jgi:hypothetical protein
VHIINNLAERELRADFVTMIRKTLPNCDPRDFDGICKHAGELAATVEEEYCSIASRKNNCPILRM